MTGLLIAFIMVVMILMLIAIAIFHTAIWITHWSESLRKDNLYIKYSDFKKSYDINPDRWDLRFDNVRFQKEGSSYSYNKTTFQFYPIGYYKYRLWRNLIERKQYKANKKATYQEVMSQVKASTQYAPISRNPSPSIEIEAKDKKHRDTILQAVTKRLKEEFSMDVKITDSTNKEAKDE